MKKLRLKVDEWIFPQAHSWTQEMKVGYKQGIPDPLSFPLHHPVPLWGNPRRAALERMASNSWGTWVPLSLGRVLPSGEWGGLSRETPLSSSEKRQHKPFSSKVALLCCSVILPSPHTKWAVTSDRLAFGAGTFSLSFLSSLLILSLK